MSLFSLVPIGHVGRIFSHDFTLSLLIHRRALAWPFARARVEGRSASRTTSGGRAGDPDTQERLFVSVARLGGVAGLKSNTAARGFGRAVTPLHVRYLAPTKHDFSSTL